MFIGSSYGQLQFEGPVEIQRAFGTAIDLSQYQQTFMFRANDDDTVALYNISIDFENGECLNPSVSIEFEPLDSDTEGDETIYVFYPTFSNESQIAACTPGADQCGDFVFCTEFEPPSGRYAELIFFVGTGDDIDDFNCGEPTRTLQGRVTVSCQIDIQSLCASQEEEEEESSSESRDNAMQEFGHRLTEQHDLENDAKHNKEAKNEVVTFKFDDDTSNNLWSMFVVGLCFCCIAQCGYIYTLNNRK